MLDYGAQFNGEPIERPSGLPREVALRQARFSCGKRRRNAARQLLGEAGLSNPNDEELSS